MITAIILIDVERGRANEVSEALVALDGISEAYSVAGEADIVAIARVSKHDDLAELIAGKVQGMPGIVETRTLIAFQAYSKQDLDAMWSIGYEETAG